MTSLPSKDSGANIAAFSGPPKSAASEARGDHDMKPGQAFTVPAGVLHCPHARERTVVLMVERAGVSPTGD